MLHFRLYNPNPLKYGQCQILRLKVFWVGQERKDCPALLKSVGEFIFLCWMYSLTSSELTRLHDDISHRGLKWEKTSLWIWWEKTFTFERTFFHASNIASTVWPTPCSRRFSVLRCPVTLNREDEFHKRSLNLQLRTVQLLFSQKDSA